MSHRQGAAKSTVCLAVYMQALGEGMLLQSHARKRERPTTHKCISFVIEQENTNIVEFIVVEVMNGVFVLSS